MKPRAPCDFRGYMPMMLALGGRRGESRVPDIQSFCLKWALAFGRKKDL